MTGSSSSLHELQTHPVVGRKRRSGDGHVLQALNLLPMRSKSKEFQGMLNLTSARKHLWDFSDLARGSAWSWHHSDSTFQLNNSTMKRLQPLQVNPNPPDLFTDFLGSRVDDHGTRLVDLLRRDPGISGPWKKFVLSAGLARKAAHLECLQHPGHPPEWKVGFHGTRFEAVYRIVTSARLEPSWVRTLWRDGDPVVGVYLFEVKDLDGYDKSEHYAVYSPLFGDGRYFAVKVEVHFDKWDCVKANRTDQRITRDRSAIPVALWFRELTGNSIALQSMVSYDWDPLMEAHPLQQPVDVVKLRLAPPSHQGEPNQVLGGLCVPAHITDAKRIRRSPEPSASALSGNVQKGFLEVGLFRAAGGTSRSICSRSIRKKRGGWSVAANRLVRFYRGRGPSTSTRRPRTYPSPGA